MTSTHDLFEPERYELREAPLYRFSLDRRDFVQFTATGIFIFAFASAARGQWGQSGPMPLETRIHIGEDGFVTVLTGKIEEGQGARTEMAMAAAEELRLPLGRVRVVMADTNLVPNDGITAGSRTTPANIPAVRRACATARRLLESASEAAGKKLTYAELAVTRTFATANKEAVSNDVPLTPPKDWKILGTPVHRVNARDIVTGAHEFPADVRRPNMMYGVVLRAPSYGATLEAIDLDAALKIEGATAVRDGDFVACAAPTSYAARQAAKALAATAKWKTTQQTSVDVLYDHLRKTARPNPRAQTNGSVEDALSKAKQKFRATFQAAYIQHAPMEPRAALAEWNGDKLTVWTGSSNPFGVRSSLAEAFSMKPENVRVFSPDFGGGFGGKHTGEAALEAARLARHAKRPVHLRWTRAEEFSWAYFRPAALIDIEAALDENGRIAAWDFTNFNSGASAIDCHYAVPNTRTRFVSTDMPLRQGSYRALASTANNFARECFTDELAAAAGKDPLSFRLAHLDNPRIKAVLAAAAERFRFAERVKQRTPNRGVGIACGTEKNSVVAACVEIEIVPGQESPRVIEIVQAYECGAILNPAGLRQQVEGCIIQGLGAALREEILFENGRVTNASFASYRVPRFADTPKIDLVLLDRKDADPIGAGETPIIVIAPAIANAVAHATGKRIRSMPIRL